MVTRQQIVKVFSPNIIRNDDDLDNLREFLKNINSQIDKRAFSELHIFDDGSEEGWREEYGKLEQEFPWLNICYAEKNIGLAKILIKAHKMFCMMGLDDEDVVVKLDSDNEHDPAKIPELVSKLDENFSGAICQIEYSPEHLDVYDAPLNRSQGALQGKVIFGDETALKHNSPGFSAYKVKVLKSIAESFQDYIDRYEKRFNSEFRWGGDIVIMFLAKSAGFEINLETTQKSIHKAPNRDLDKVVKQSLELTQNLSLMLSMKNGS
jgi:hypothetical protein